MVKAKNMSLFYFTFILIALHAYMVFAYPYEEYILAPVTRDVRPVAIYDTNGNVSDATDLVSSQDPTPVTFSGADSWVTLDFGINLSGHVYSLFIRPDKCDALSGSPGLSKPLRLNVTTGGFVTASKEYMRGEFHYLIVSHGTAGSVSISNLTVHWNASPDMENPRDYVGYFNSDNEKLNRVWYAGVYTNQLCSIDPTTGGIVRLSENNWFYNYTISEGVVSLVDGAKRDRVVWSGDIVVSAPSMFVSTNKLDGIRNAINHVMSLQLDDGRLPWAGLPFQNPDPSKFQWSFTYHLHALNNIYEYYLFTGDLEYLVGYWPRYKKAMEFSLDTIDETGLADVPTGMDWLRSGMGGHNVEANAIFYHSLLIGAKVARLNNDHAAARSWTKTAESIKEEINARLWDDDKSLFWDNDPAAISESLKARWIRPYGAPAPEAGNTVSPFASGFELRAHYVAGFSERAIELMELMWADHMLDNPAMTNSSFVEGYAASDRFYYPPYPNPAGVSHAHGWATTPTFTLTFLGVGLEITSAQGKTWSVTPRLGTLGRATAGFETSLGQFSASWTSKDGRLRGTFNTPSGTRGTLTLSTVGDKTLRISGPRGNRKVAANGKTSITLENLAGGKYHVELA
ncbi:hypothetical protein MRS44_005279 [Fusarium solani]|uniref:uncharacterized protein n=1 Tax=Fusarium solani TaxID=169388 RepID=UPI0032C42F53|nr:hypothetical protein MRS44_005279 [Fusarium solani]